MSDVYYVSGKGIGFKQSSVAKVPVVDDSRIIADAPKQLSQKRVFNYHRMTAGELSLMFLLAETELKKAYYGDLNGVYSSAEIMISRILRNGLHTPGVAVLTGNVSPELYQLASQIVKAKRKAGPAAGSISTSSLASQIGNGFDPYGDGDIIDINCDNILPTIPIFTTPPNGGPATIEIEANPEYQECLETMDWVNRLNDFFGDSAHHLLYDYLPSSDENFSIREVEFKAFDHKKVFDKIADQSSFERDQLKEWGNYGIQRHNVKKGGEPLDPVDSVYAIRQKTEEDIGFAIASLIAVITAVASALTAAGLLVNSLKGPQKIDFQNQLPNVGLPTFGPEQTDFEQFIRNSALQTGTPTIPGGSTTTTGTNTNLILGAGAVAAGLYLINRK